MPIKLFTGLPGHGKTSLAVEDMLRESEKHAKAAKDARPLWAFGFDGLNVEHVHVGDDPREWNAVDENGEHVIPDGALIYVDEAWKHFGHLQEARGATPPHVLALAEHRHRGIDFVWTTQMPSQLYPFARALCEGHTHTCRKHGTEFIETFTWGELCEDVKSIPRREAAIRVTRRLPKKAFDAYKSATLHTIKRRIPARLIVLPVSLVLGIGALVFAVNTLRPSNAAERIEEADAAQAAPASASAQGRAGRLAYTTAEEYAVAVTPRIRQMPWTAPAFDGRPVQSNPRVFCALGGDGADANGERKRETCTCLTEQGTRYAMAFRQCAELARGGEPYNPFLAPAVAREDRGAGGTPADKDRRSAPAPEATRGAGRAEELQAGYGAFRPRGG